MFDWLRKRRARARAKAAGTTQAERPDDPGRKAWLLAKQGFLDDAAAVLRASDDPRHEGMLALLLREYGRLDESISVLRASTDPESAPRLEQFLRERGGQLARLTMFTAIDGRPPERTREVDDLLSRGLIDEAIDLLKVSRLPADRTRLQALLRELGRTDELRELANHSIRLATLRAAGRLDELRTLAESGDREARTLLTEALAEQGGPASVYDPYAGEKAFDELIKQGLVDEAAAALAERPEALVDDEARYRLVRLYADQGRAEEAIAVLRTRRSLAPDLLAELLVDTDRVAEAIAVLDVSKQRGAQRKAAQLRAEHGYLDELRARADAGDRLSAEQLAAHLSAHAELDELRTRAAIGDAVFGAQLIRALGQLGRLDELETLAPAAPAAGVMWWATLLAKPEADPSAATNTSSATVDTSAATNTSAATDTSASTNTSAAADTSSAAADTAAVRAALDEHADKASWYAGENPTAAVIDLLVEKRRISTAIAFAEARVSAGDEWAGQWIPRPPQTRFPREEVAMWQLLASNAATAIRELLPTSSAAERSTTTSPAAAKRSTTTNPAAAKRSRSTSPAAAERSTTVSIADADYALYADLRVTLPSPDRAEIALACWTVHTDTARYFGDHPPDEAETKLEPEGTAIPDLRLTVGVIDDLAGRLKTRDLPQPHPGGRHLTITIVLPTP